MKRLPRAAAALAWMVGAVAMHAVVPLELSRLGDRVDRRGRTRGAVQSTLRARVTGQQSRPTTG